MANELALARSFYSWIAKIQIRESKDFLQMPTAYSTDLMALKELTVQLNEQLRGTKYGDRARYWKRIFESNTRSMEPLDESARRAFIAAVRRVFIPHKRPKTLPADTVLMKMAKASLRKLKAVGGEYEAIRQSQWSYQYFTQLYHEDDLTALSNSVNYTVGSEDDIEPGDRNKLGYKLRLWAYALWPINGVRFIKLIAEGGEKLLGNFFAVLVFTMRKAFGDAATKKAVNDVLKTT